MAGKKKKAKNAKKRFKKTEAATPEVGSLPLKNLRHELFCKLYAGHMGMNAFGNGTRCYINAFGYDVEIIKLREQAALIAEKRERGFTTKVQMVILRVKAKEKVAQVQASILLSKPMISERIDFLMDNISNSDNFADRELAFVMGQRHDLASKVSAIRHFDDKKGRIVKRLDVTSDGEPIKSIEIVSPATMTPTKK